MTEPTAPDAPDRPTPTSDEPDMPPRDEAAAGEAASAAAARPNPDPKADEPEGAATGASTDLSAEAGGPSSAAESAPGDSRAVEVIAPTPLGAEKPRRRAIHAPPSPAADLRVAHVLLRVGNALPARVHLETLAGRRQLDLRGLLDLAESRWRTADLAGAGEAVAAYLEAGGEAPLGFLIAAEATVALGRPGEARKLARRATDDLEQSLDAVFAGQPRSDLWPPDPATPVPPAGTLFPEAPTDAARGGRIGLTTDPRPASAAGGAASSSVAASGSSSDADPAASMPIVSGEVEPDRSIWDAGPPVAPNAQVELDAARAALEAGDARAAAVRFGIVLRMSPALAPLVLDLVGELPGPDFDLLRGDALRLAGHEAAAERAFAAAADALREPTNSPRSPE